MASHTMSDIIIPLIVWFVIIKWKYCEKNILITNVLHNQKAWEKRKCLLSFILAVKPVLETKISIKKSEKSGNYIPNWEGSGSSSRSKISKKFKILLK